MVKTFILLMFLMSGSAMASTTRTITADTIKNAANTITTTIPALSGTAMVSAGISQQVPSGTVNSSNTSFTLTNSPGVTATLTLYLDGIVQTQTVDYTLSGSTITMTTAPSTGQSLTATYSRF